MEHAWNYVGAGYGIAIVTIASYVTWVLRRTRRLRRALATDGSARDANE
jgi:heme exporter protein CcmD